MTTEATGSIGTKLLRGDGMTPTETFTAIAEVLNIDGPNLSRETTEVTPLVEQWNKYYAGAADGGEVSFELNFIPTDATQGATNGLLKDFIDGVDRNFKLEFPDTAKTTWAFTAIVTGFSPTAARNQQLKASVTLKVTGAPTFGPAV